MSADSRTEPGRIRPTSGLDTCQESVANLEAEIELESVPTADDTQSMLGKPKDSDP